MTAEQRQLIDELRKIEREHQGDISTIAWRAAQEIYWLLQENERLQTPQKPH